MDSSVARQESFDKFRKPESTLKRKSNQSSPIVQNFVTNATSDVNNKPPSKHESFSKLKQPQNQNIDPNNRDSSQPLSPRRTFFRKERLVKVSKTEVRNIEDLTSETLIRSIDALDSSGKFQIYSCKVLRIQQKPDKPETKNTTREVEFCPHSHSNDSESSAFKESVNVWGPFFVLDKGWCSLNPSLSMRIFSFRFSQLNVGDIILAVSEKPPKKKPKKQIQINSLPSNESLVTVPNLADIQTMKEIMETQAHANTQL